MTSFTATLMCRIIFLLMWKSSMAQTDYAEQYIIHTLPSGPQPLICRRESANSSEVILRTTFQRLSDALSAPRPYRRYCIWEEGEVCDTGEFERRNGAVYLGQDMDLDTSSFTIFAHVRLEPRDNMDNWGGRILSKRTSNKRGWQFVVPSFYGHKISLYMNDDPGHITYGETVIPDRTWLTVAITVNRDEFRSNNLATVQAYFNGLPDGSPYIVMLDSSLSTEAPLTVGNWMYEDHTYHAGRKDWRSPNRRNHYHRFYGSIRDLTVWKRALTPAQILHYSEMIVTKNGHNPSCDPGWRPFECKCYKLFPTPLHFNMAWETCEAEDGRLVVVDSQEVQDFVWGLVVVSSDQDFWIGLNDTVNENVWKFSNGYNLNYFIGQWNNFPNRFPDKEYKTDDCAEIKKLYAGKWNDANCNKFNPFICERRPRTC